MSTEELDSLCATVEIDDRPVRVLAAEDFVSSGRIVLRPWGEYEGDERPLLGSISWSRIQYAAALDAHVAAEDMVDDHSQDLFNLHTSLFDSKGDVRADLGTVGGVGLDVLVIDWIEVPEGSRFTERAAALLEHLLRFWAGGCFCAAYIEETDMRPAVKELLLERGFRWCAGRACNFWFTDLGAPRPPLPGEPPRATQLGPGGIKH